MKHLQFAHDLPPCGDDELRRVTTIPIVMCPHCGTRMALSRIAPAAKRPEGRLHFACSCGFGYPADIGFSRRL